MRSDDDGTIDLRGGNDEPEFRINGVREQDAGKVPEAVLGKLEVAPIAESSDSVAMAYDKVKVKFDKFVNLIATHAYEDILEKHVDDDVIISTDLLTDLANAHEEKQDRSMPLTFLIGIVMGIVLTWILLRT